MSLDKHLYQETVTRWQPIETAPKDGTKIDIVAKIWEVQIDKFLWQRFCGVWWHSKSEMWMGMNGLYRATHWMPIPELPREI